MDRYGEAIAADLADRGWDLRKLWAQRDWDLLLTIIDRLPRNSAYIEAMTGDDQWAEQVLSRPGRRSDPTPPMSEWTLEAELLTGILDRLGELTALTAAAAGGKPKRPQPAPRPRTALDRVRSRRRKAQHQRLVAVLLPHKASQAP